MTARVHLLRDRQEGPLRFGACGISGKVTTAHGEVTCRACMRRMAKHVVINVHPGNTEGLGQERLVTGGARSIPASAKRIIEESRAGSVERRARFGSWASLHDLHAAVVDDGSPVRSSSDPSRFGSRVSTSARPARGVGRDDIVAIDLALQRACSAGVYVAGVLVGHAEVLAVYLARCEGQPFAGRIAEQRKGRVTRRLGCSAEDVAKQWGGGHTAHHVALLVREVRRRALPLLVRAGLMEGDSEEVAMNVPGFDLQGWKEIAHVIGVAEITAKRCAHSSPDPLPVSRVTLTGKAGSVVAKREEVLAWMGRRVVPVAGSAS